MKKIVLGMLLVMMIAVSAEARDMKPGTVKLSGATSASIFNTSTDINGDDAGDVDTFNLETDAIYFLTKNVGVGGGVFYENSDGDDFESETLVIGPTVAVDVPINPSLNFVADASVGYFKNEEDNIETDGLAWQLSAGVAMFPANYVSLNLTAGYMGLDGEGDYDLEASSYGLDFGVSVYFD